MLMLATASSICASLLIASGSLISSKRGGETWSDIFGGGVLEASE